MKNIALIAVVWSLILSLGFGQENLGDSSGEPPHLNQNQLAVLERAAEGGDASEQVRLGLIYVKGEGMPQDYSQALKWFRKAAEQGHPSAQYNLGPHVPQGARGAGERCGGGEVD